ncbi:replication-relaxation family protein [Nocardiopsis salina]|uniref:replication-relaxation family protein n=1 Tax=Nocardiopsis salina TaxID=245836 RepID=UPI0009FFC7BA|nr:replication-relaxation family protein [Nocardiopsis salina]
MHTHRVLTTPQVAQVAFNSQSRAVQRMRILTGLGLVARFRPRRDRGSAPWHYVLDTAGAHVMAAEGGRNTDRASVRRDRQLALARSAHLDHRVGANGFFTALVAAGRASEGTAELGEWLNASGAHGWAEFHTRDGLIPVPRADGFGRWDADGQSVAFFLEWDTGSETHRQLHAKMQRYVDFAPTLVGPMPWVLFVFPTARRETHARSALRRVQGTDHAPVATAHLPEAHHPEKAVWWPLKSTAGRVLLSGLPEVDAWV